ncbi:OmpA family protein [Pedobacter rhizosphaerae]|uniref:OmpA-OmpF porin, OOP family n=1 Tax=Pedobacter rhizosphaerae TaxID=390241 RepID=A0A1H9L9C5_9SPHI|nr:OmpA family protein [Pedobacter rhizosphaerae]SER08111.1 OmpA-OmpF porin, OOP family [Pedobacter rhizosphaerae]
MKLTLFKVLPVAVAGLFIGSTANAQETPTNTAKFRTWSIGVNAGVLTPLSPLGGKNDFSNNKSSLGYGLYVKKQFTNYFSLRLDGVRGKLKGDNTEPYESGLVNSSPVRAFDTDLSYSASLSAVVNMFNIDLFKKENALQLYTSVGAGLAGYKPTITTAAGTFDYAGDKTISELIIPVGVGAKFKISDGINFDLGWTINFVDGDNLDGYYRGSNDKYNYAYAGLEFALGTGKQLAFHNPVAVTYDEAVKAKQTADALKSDLDAQKSENAKLRTEMADLLKDTDGDGVADKLDKCPGTPAGTVVDGAGCPLKTPEKVVEKVVVTEADRKVVADAIKNLEFDLGKATIRQKSYATLNRVAALLIEKNFSLKLAGHTDNTGSKALNLRLSKDRAESVKAYLVSQGANASRIEATGYGMGQPIATNKTAAGRQQNRRVEFTLY